MFVEDATLDADEVIPATLTLSFSENISAISGFSVDIVITGTE
jgi:hypothetical protein